MKLDDLKNTKVGQMPENARLLMGRVEIAEHKQDAPCSLDDCLSLRQGSAQSVVISLVRFASRELDSDNLSGSFKALRDSIAQSIGLDDGDKRIRWEYGQCETRGEQGTLVSITLL